MWGVFKEGKKCIFRRKYSSFFICQPSTWPSAATAAAHAKAPTWCTPAWATANPAPSPPGTRCWWPPTSPTTSRRPRAAAPSAGTPRWEPHAAGGMWEKGEGLWSGLTVLRLLAGQSSPGLPPRPPPRRNRDPDGEGVPLRHVPQVALLKPRRRVSRHPLVFLLPVSGVAAPSFHCNPAWGVWGGATFALVC